jgi:hypothetical protein
MLTLIGCNAEVDLLQEWIPGIDGSSNCKDLSDGRRVISITKNIPFPFSNRQMIVCAHGFAIPERKAFIICLNSISKEYEDLWDTPDTFGDPAMARGLLNGF